MRKRIDLHDLHDVSDRGEMFCDCYEGAPTFVEPPDLEPVLRDEVLWKGLVAARKVVSDFEALVYAACKPEPLDDVEREIAPQMWRLMRGRRGSGHQPVDWHEQYKALRERLKKHSEEE